nr:hypothetical protein [uncultured Criibacterium sp.]
MLEEKNFKKIIIIATILVALLVAVSYTMYYKSMPQLSKDGQVSEKAEENRFPILPFDAFSMVKSDLTLKFGEGTQGDGSNYDNQYIDYDQHWFNKDFKARYYYGLQDRIYQINLPVKKDDIKAVYEEMKVELGTPFYDSLFDKSKPLEESYTHWIKDSTRYSLLYDQGQAFVKMKLEYYANPDGHNLGARPTVIQRIDNDKKVLGGDASSILLIGDKEEYTQKYYKNLYVVLGSKKGSIVGRLPKDTDGGMYPKMSIMDINGSGNQDILIEADNEYLKWFTGFEYKDGKLNVIYSKEDRPEEGDTNNKLETEKEK